ncbi:hypothetical protein SAMN05421820_11585 [Pedobacter steynii]|uniref:Lipoprotein n=1 Tax=Pedobacter steynii TaxID=430522 RepID=A0A1H0JV68_9SPHI|nr:hypothetical protein [Pedobacter steynii]NQX43170.1 hypothetical protein [Pedobacter steynii]SDO47494.1 hypothetical protein SAMN05421820_11585 [Pedobacter steynii]
MKTYGLFVILGLLMLQACGLLRKTSRNSSIATLQDKEEIRMDSQSKAIDQQEGRSLILRNDSLDSYSQTEIWPKGRFDLSPEKGFSGQAEKVLIRRKGKFGSRSLEKKEEVKQQIEESKQAQSQLKTKDFSQKDMEKKSSSFSGWYLLLLLILLIFIWYRFKR